MPLNSAGVDALQNAGHTVTMYAAIGSGNLSTNENSTSRVAVSLGTSSGGVMTASGTPLNFTGTANAAATNVLFFSAATAGTFYGYQALTGDQTYNASGNYSITSLTVTGTGV